MAYAIKKGSDYFQSELYAGDGTSPRDVLQNGNFSPDLVWIKDRTNGSTSHWLFDTVRGSAGGALGVLFSDTTDAEYTSGTGIGGNATAFTGTGVTTTAGSSTNDNLNKSSANYVGWKWKGGESTVENTDGTITSQVSANPTAGFSVVTWTGNGATSTIGHGLGVAPKFIITKIRNVADGWYWYHADIGNTKFIRLDSTGASTTSTIFGNTSPTSTVFTFELGVYNAVAYCFAEVEGYSKIGSYTGNASADGPFVYTGFRPAFVLIKATNVSGVSWVIHDTSRRTYNYHGEELYPNSSGSAANASTERLDILSNGFKLRTTANSLNGSYNYIYMAFAETPMKFANAR